MPTVGLFNKEGNKIEDIQLNETIFAAEVNADAMHQVVVALLANKRQGTQSAKTRAEVRGGGIKPWRQKGTGRARQGSIRAPQWIKGGVVFAPKPRDYRMSIPKSMRRVAMLSALTSKVQNDEMIVLGNQPYYYIYLDKQPQYKYFFQLPIMLYDSSIREENLNYIMQNNPKMLIKYMEGYSEEKFNEIYGIDLENYIRNNYEEHVSKKFKYYVLNEK